MLLIDDRENAVFAPLEQADPADAAAVLLPI